MKRNKSQGKMVAILVAFFLCAIILGIFMLQRYEEGDRAVTPTPVPQQAGPVTLTLFFGAPDGDGLVREGRNVESCGNAADCIVTIVQELANGPMGDLEQTLPGQTVVRSVHTERDVVTIDLEHGFVEGVPAGSAGEMAAIYSIVDSVIINFPSFHAVRFLVDGKPVDTLHGHLDLRQPLAADFSLEKKQPQEQTTQQ